MRRLHRVTRASDGRRARVPQARLGVFWTPLDIYWPLIVEIANAREHDKGWRETSKRWAFAGRQHLLGVIGEITFALATGIPLDYVATLMPKGDGGVVDFPGSVQVKAVAVVMREPHLKEDPDRAAWADYYVLAWVDVMLKRGALLGWCEGRSLATAPLEGGYGHGARRVLDARDLSPFVYFPVEYHIKAQSTSK